MIAATARGVRFTTRASPRFRPFRVAGTLTKTSHKNTAQHPTENVLHQSNYYKWGGAFLVAVVGTSIFTRTWRRQRLDERTAASEAVDQRQLQQWRVDCERAGLIGKAKSVAHELDHLRAWHAQNGFKGGLVLRELDEPLFVDKNNLDSDGNVTLPPSHKARRECYYLYYELRPNGHVHQEIFCRGTTLMADIGTCLQFWMVHDEELGCWVHRGFRQQADRILEDVTPLLAPPTDRRATLCLSGHSLGGAVAFLMAAKLQKRGYRVEAVTSVGAPRFCAKSSVPSLQALLPQRNILIEDDCDIVTFVPPSLKHVGHKLYCPRHRPPVYFEEPLWTDSVLLNFGLWEIVSQLGRPHRIKNYLVRLDHCLTR